MKRWQGWAQSLDDDWYRDKFGVPTVVRDKSEFFTEPVTLLPTAELAALEAKAAKWKPIDDDAKSGKPVLVYYLNSYQKSRVVKACWVPKYTEESSEDHAEYCEEKDNYYSPEGWYELIDNWGDYSSVAICEGEPTHYMPLPKFDAKEESGE